MYPPMKFNHPTLYPQRPLTLTFRYYSIAVGNDFDTCWKSPCNRRLSASDGGGQIRGRPNNQSAQMSPKSKQDVRICKRWVESSCRSIDTIPDLLACIGGSRLSGKECLKDCVDTCLGAFNPTCSCFELWNDSVPRERDQLSPSKCEVQVGTYDPVALVAFWIDVADFSSPTMVLSRSMLHVAFPSWPVWTDWPNKWRERLFGKLEK